MLLYIIHNILNTGRYGARETRTGRNMKNEIVGVILSSGDSSRLSESLINDHIPKEKTELGGVAIRATISGYITKHKRAD